MSYSSKQYIHELDKKAFDALNKFPKFIKLWEMFNSNYNEKAAKFDFLSSAIRLNENQMPEIYNLLPPICEKLGIDIPELYYVKSKEINAATGGYKTPYIFVTSELVETLPAESISSVLAHECGHIACKHYLYHSLVSMIINGVDNSPLAAIPGFTKYITPSLFNAMLFWDRCSELSADRAAVLCDGNADITVDALLKVHGYDNVNRDEFIKQAFDLKEFTEASSNKALTEMLMQGESHPRMATRVYECCEWFHSDQYKSIINGTYTVEDAEKAEQQEYISADINMSGESDGIGIEDIDARLQVLNAELDKYTNKATKLEYAYSIYSGILSGIIDSVFVGETRIAGTDLALSHKQVNNFIQEYAKARGFDNTRLNDAIADLENAFKVAQDNVWKGADIGVSAKNHHLADLAHHPTPLGLMSSIIVQFLRIGSFVNKEGEWHFIFVKTSIKDIVEIVAPAIITGALNWLVTLAEKKYEAEKEDEMPKALRAILRAISSAPIILEVAKCADNWFGHLVSDMGGSKNTAGGGMGIPGVFLSLLYEISSLPLLKDSGMPTFINNLYEKEKFDLRHELSLCKNIGRQAIPVIFNEVYVRLGYFIMHLAAEAAAKKTIEGYRINWSNMIPFGNRTVNRMLTVASMTFTTADTADAAVHAALESAGNWVLFSGKFVTRFNFLGAGRAAMAIVKEISSESKEAELIHEKLILTEAKTLLVMEAIETYKAQLEERLANYLAEDIEIFISGFDSIFDKRELYLSLLNSYFWSVNNC